MKLPGIPAQLEKAEKLLAGLATEGIEPTLVWNDLGFLSLYVCTVEGHRGSSGAVDEAIEIAISKWKARG